MHITVIDNSLPFSSPSSVGSYLFVKLNISCLALGFAHLSKPAHALMFTSLSTLGAVAAPQDP